MAMNMEQLQRLPRRELQTLAKSWGVKANVKSAEIIRQLITKQGGGPPRLFIQIPRRSTINLAIKREESGDELSGEGQLDGSASQTVEEHPEGTNEGRTAEVLSLVDEFVASVARNGAQQGQLSAHPTEAQSVTTVRQDTPSASQVRLLSQPQSHSRSIRRSPTPGPSARVLSGLARTRTIPVQVEAGVQTDGRLSPVPRANSFKLGVPDLARGRWRKLMRRTTKYVDTAPDFRKRVDDLFTIKTAAEQHLNRFDNDIIDIRRMRHVGEQFMAEWKDNSDLWNGSKVPNKESHVLPGNVGPSGRMPHPSSDNDNLYAGQPAGQANRPVARDSGSHRSETLNVQTHANDEIEEDEASEEELSGRRSVPHRNATAVSPETGISLGKRQRPNLHDEDDARESEEDTYKHRRVRPRT